MPASSPHSTRAEKRSGLPPARFDVGDESRRAALRLSCGRSNNRPAHEQLICLQPGDDVSTAIGRGTIRISPTSWRGMPSPMPENIVLRLDHFSQRRPRRVAALLCVRTQNFPHQLSLRRLRQSRFTPAATARLTALWVSGRGAGGDKSGQIGLERRPKLILHHFSELAAISLNWWRKPNSR